MCPLQVMPPLHEYLPFWTSFARPVIARASNFSFPHSPEPSFTRIHLVCTRAARDGQPMIRRTLLAIFLAPAALLVAAPPPLPKALTSFGAATCDGSVYVYGGHMG